MSSTRRWLLWFLLLAASAALVLFDKDGDGAPSQEPGVIEAVARDSDRPPSGGGSRRAGDRDDAMILAIRERKDTREIRDPFSPHDWTPPPPPPAPAAPVEPKAPPVPYRVLGKKLEDGAWQVFLTHQERVYVVKQGETLDNTYRIEEIRPPRMVLTYLPMNERQVLAIGGDQ